MIAEENARAIIRSHSYQHPIIGKCIALENWAILMEPDLMIDLKSFLSGISQNTTIVLLLDSPIRNGQYHNIDLSTLEYYQPE